MKVRHYGGFHATEKQIDAIVEVSRGSRMDESWFGEISEAINNKGEKVHVVKDLENGHWLSLKFAVKVMNEGISSVRDYVEDPALIDAYEKLLVELGIVDGDVEIGSSWAVRVASKSRVDLIGLMKCIENEDHFHNRLRPMRVLKQRGANAYYLDIGGAGSWSRSPCLWYCASHDVPFDVCFDGPDMVVHHVIRYGNGTVFSETLKDRMPLFMKASDIIKGKGWTNGKVGKGKYRTLRGV